MSGPDRERALAALRRAMADGLVAAIDDILLGLGWGCIAIAVLGLIGWAAR